MSLRVSHSGNAVRRASASGSHRSPMERRAGPRSCSTAFASPTRFTANERTSSTPWSTAVCGLAQEDDLRCSRAGVAHVGPDVVGRALSVRSMTSSRLLALTTPSASFVAKARSEERSERSDACRRRPARTRRARRTARTTSSAQARRVNAFGARFLRRGSGSRVAFRPGRFPVYQACVSSHVRPPSLIPGRLVANERASMACLLSRL